MPSTTPDLLGRRDRKRLETQARIEAAATSLVLRDGLEATTVEAISELADISRRTFFNYFESKDSAILGLQPHDQADEALRAHLEQFCGGALVPSVVGLVFAVMGTPGTVNTAIHRDRMEIIRRHPEIMSSQFALLQARKTRMAEAVALMLAAHPDFAQDSDIAFHGEVVFALCASAAGAACREWSKTADPSTFEEMEKRTVALVESTLRRLS